MRSLVDRQSGRADQPSAPQGSSGPRSGSGSTAVRARAAAVVKSRRVPMSPGAPVLASSGGSCSSLVAVVADWAACGSCQGIRACCLRPGGAAFGLAVMKRAERRRGRCSSVRGGRVCRLCAVGQGPPRFIAPMLLRGGEVPRNESNGRARTVRPSASRVPDSKAAADGGWVGRLPPPRRWRALPTRTPGRFRLARIP
jgi:hypothetical protein